ncbi:MAG: Hsp20/alpha crystallin family protein [Bacteroidota bacterium]
MDEKDKGDGGEKLQSVRRMVEDITVTPFFSRHTGHMPATIKLHAHVTEDDDHVKLSTEVPGFSEDQVEVTATVNTINIVLHSGQISAEKGDIAEYPEDVSLNSSYFMDTPIDPENIKITRKGDNLEITVPKKKTK